MVSYTTRKFHKSFNAKPCLCYMKNKALGAWPHTLFSYSTHGNALTNKYSVGGRNRKSNDHLMIKII